MNMQMDFKTVEKKEQNCNEEIQIKCIKVDTTHAAVVMANNCSPSHAG